ncbi:Disintegrin and metalloproteinase domain-containing protein B [Smittium culicis]|uniref:Disintegrin and metalloproteinase domain-containing protein B n=1 Tax=Smittium culicis TaxID=133412 RepID=A0A1R1Y945_9FUNG|nr:Disintegrin and metalloproteinase domain-containing protein B [Smittium culicis]
MDLNAYNNTYRLILEPNNILLHPNASFSSIDLKGKSKTKLLTLDNIGIYRGKVLRLNADPFSSIFQSWEKDFRKRSSHEFDEEETWARISIQKNNNVPKIDGAFYIDGETFYIKPIDVYKRTKRSLDPSITSISHRSDNEKDSTSIIYKQSDFVNQNINSNDIRNGGTCQTQPPPGEIYRIEEHDPHYAFGGLVDSLTLRKRQTTTFSDQAALDAGCLSAKKIMYMGAAADCTYVTLYGGSEGARSQILSNWNQASAIYERQFNIALGLIYMEVVDSSCSSTADTSRPWNRDCLTSYPLSNRLSDFSKWRGGRKDDGAGLWHLLTNCPSGSDVGLAWLGSVCETSSTNSNSAGGGYYSGTGVSSSTRDEFKVIAHEIGHNFGAVHDCNGSTCNCNGGACSDCCPCTSSCSCDGKFIMNPSSPVATNDFSPCSIKYICNNIGSKAVKCLSDIGTKPVLGVAMCGNGVLEAGEECDCGTSDDCKSNPCCDWQTCKLKNGAQCLDKNSLCCKDCKILPKNTVCRPKYGECDIEDICDGTSAECPPDSHVEDGTNCGTSSGLKCASGVCTSRDAQCSARSGSEGFNKYCKIGTFGNLCDFQCQSSSSRSICMLISGTFIEGTSCGLNAFCRKGSCKGTNWFYSALLIFQRSLLIAIPLGIVIALIVFFIVYKLLQLLFSLLCCAGLRKKTQTTPLIPQPIYPPDHIPMNPPVYGYNFNNNSNQTPIIYPPTAQFPPAPHNNLRNLSNNNNNQNNSSTNNESNWVDPALYNGAYTPNNYRN